MLVIDIGNTSISFALVKNGQCLEPKTISQKYYPVLKKYNKLTSKVIISSVVPSLDKKVNSYFPNKTIFVNDKNIPIKIKTNNPKEVGSDRLVNSYGALRKYGAPIIIIDFGTATTFDIVSSKKEYMGGIICPGLELSRQALAQNTAKLPLVTLYRPKHIIGKTTEEAIESGLVFGYEEMVKGLLKRIKKEMPKNTLVCATGGYCKLICEDISDINIINLTLTLEGLILLGKIL